ncbi:MAG: alpha-2-macroglobulin family protein, partial [Bacteroidota bacterium]
MNRWLLFPAFILFCLFYSCQSKDNRQSTHSPFHDAISAFTSGQISAGSSVVIEFASPVENAEPGEPADELFSIKPSVDGEAKWAGKRTLVFEPSENLPSGTEFKAEVNLPKLMPREKEPFFFTFRTKTRNAWLSEESLGPASLADTENYQAEVKLTLADIVKEKEIRENVEARYKGRPVSLEFSRLDDLNYLITAGEIERGDKAQPLTVEVKKGTISPDEKKSLKISIPGRDEFKILSARKASAPRHMITVTFSDPLDPNQDVSGLFRLGNNDIDWNIDNNRVKLYPDESVRGEQELLITSDVKNIDGEYLDASGKFTFSFSKEKPEVEIIGDGTVIPYSDGLYLPFRAVSLKAVRVRVIKIYEHNIGHFLQANRLSGSSGLKRAGRLVHRQRIKLDNDPTLDAGKWNTFSLDLSRFIQPDPGAIYRVELGFEQSDADYPCSDNQQDEDESEEEVEYNEEADVDTIDGDFWDTPNNYYSTGPHSRPDEFSWRDRDNPCTPSYYTRDKWVSKNVLASNLGIMVKGGKDDAFMVTVTDLRTTEPLKGVDVEIFNLQMIKIGEGKTNSAGEAELGADGTPFLLIAKDDKQRGYLRMDEGRNRPVDRFDVSGETVNKGLKGFIFGERGVWRPGDSIFVSFMPMETEKETLPPNHPVTFELVNPRGKLIDKQVKSHAENRLYTFRTKSEEDAPTGTWTARITIGGVVFNKQLRIETIRPNRLKIDLEWPGEMLRSDEKTQFTINSEWLHGSPASGLKTDVRMNISQAETNFENYRNYVFDDPAREIDNQEMMLFEGDLNEEGHVSFDKVVPGYSQAPGRLSARLTTRVFEEGGAFSVSSASATLSPFDVYTGIKAPSGDDRGRLLTDEDHKIELVTVDNEGNPEGNQQLEYKVYKLNWRWWWEKSEEDLGRYISSNSREVITSESVTTSANGKATFDFRIEKPEWGRYLIRVINQESGHATGDIVMVDWPGWARESREGEGASLLTFDTDRDSYEVGDDITVTFPSSEQGRARVSVETGTSVLKSWWVEPEKEETSFSFEATEDMTPNIYISVTLIQPHAQTANNRPIRLYGVVPAKVENPETHLDPEITTAGTWRPDEKATIKVSEANNKEMDYVLAVVDEGLLDLTNFSTPDPWQRFNAREALGVKTWDIYDNVIGAFGGKIEQIFSIGGDSELDKEGDKNQMRRFEPMVRFIGPSHLKKRKENTHTLDIPSYTGSVRVMVIGTSEKATGSNHDEVTIKKPVMVWSSLPRVVSPNEKLSLPVSVFTTEENINKVTVSLESSDHYEITGKKKKTVNFDSPGEKNVFFEVRTKEKTGTSQLNITAKGNGETAKLTKNINVRMPNPPVTRNLSTIINAGKSDVIDYELPGIEGTNSATLEASVIPPMDLTGRLKYLLRYPHGCIEQITSGAFPQLYIDDVVELTEEERQKMQKNIHSVLDRFSSFQTQEGGFGYWPGRNHVNSWSSSYAGHFMLEAEKQGYTVPPGMKSDWLSSQKRLANDWLPGENKRRHGSRQMEQAYRLYTLALAEKPSTGAMNRLRQQDNIVIQARWLLASAYALSGMHEVAGGIIDNALDPETERVYKKTYGSKLRDKAILVNTLNLLDRRETAMPIVRDVAEQLNSDDWYSTQTTAWTLMSIVNFTRGTGNDPLQFTYHLNNESPVTVGTDKPLSQNELNAHKKPNGEIKISNEGDSELFVSLIMNGTPGGIDSTKISDNLKLRTQFLSMNDNPLSIDDIEQGTDFKYIVRVSNPGTAGDAENLALTHMVPSAWEIRNTRLEGTESNEYDTPDYRDIRDDRVYSYFDLEAGESKEFVVVVHAAFTGEFYLPPVSCEAMYNHNI